MVLYFDDPNILVKEWYHNRWCKILKVLGTGQLESIALVRIVVYKLWIQMIGFVGFDAIYGILCARSSKIEVRCGGFCELGELDGCKDSFYCCATEWTYCGAWAVSEYWYFNWVRGLFLNIGILIGRVGWPFNP